METTAPLINRLATQLTLCQVTEKEIDKATRLLEKIVQKLRGEKMTSRNSESLTLKLLPANYDSLAILLTVV